MNNKVNLNPVTKFWKNLELRKNIKNFYSSPQVYHLWPCHINLWISASITHHPLSLSSSHPVYNLPSHPTVKTSWKLDSPMPCWAPEMLKPYHLPSLSCCCWWSSQRHSLHPTVKTSWIEELKNPWQLTWIYLDYWLLAA